MEEVIDEVLPVSRKLNFMFLGGTLDHAQRPLLVETALNVPADEVYYQLIHNPPLPGHGPSHPTYEPAEKQMYLRHRVASGTLSWWVFILEGYDPPRSHVLDSCPFPRL